MGQRFDFFVVIFDRNERLDQVLLKLGVTAIGWFHMKLTICKYKQVKLIQSTNIVDVLIQ